MTQQRAIETRSKIVEAAAAVFARHGYAGTSLSELLAESGLTKGAFYFHFSSKEELALETMRAKQQHLLERMTADVPATATGIDRLALLLRARARALEAEPTFWCVLRLGAELGSQSGPSSDYSKLNEWPIRLFADLVRESQQDGIVRPDVDPRATAEAIFGSVIGIDALASQLTAGRDLAARIDNLLHLLLHGLEPRAAARLRATTTTTTRRSR